MHSAAVIGTSKIRVAPGSTYQPGPSFVNVGAADSTSALTEMVSTLTCRLPVLRTRASTLPFSTETPSIAAVRVGLAGRTNTGYRLGAQGHRVGRRRRLIGSSWMNRRNDCSMSRAVPALMPMRMLREVPPASSTSFGKNVHVR